MLGKGAGAWAGVIMSAARLVAICDQGPWAGEEDRVKRVGLAAEEGVICRGPRSSGVGGCHTFHRGAAASFELTARRCCAGDGQDAAWMRASGVGSGVGRGRGGCGGWLYF